MTVLEKLDVDPNAFVGAERAEYLGGGLNSQVAAIDDHVIKVGRQLQEPAAAKQLADVLQAEHGAMADYVGENMPRTMYAVVASAARPSLARVVTVQERKTGMYIGDYINQPGDQVNAIPLLDFLYRSLELRDRYQIIPDLAAVQGGFNLFRSTNVVISSHGPDAHVPFLVDTNFGKVQRSDQLGRLWTRAIVWGVERGIRKLEATLG